MNDFEYKSFGSEKNATKLIIFLHGYNSCIEDIEPYATLLSQKLKDTIIIVPQSNMVCERNPHKKQWYALVDVDPERKRRKPETPTDEIVEIYNKTGQRISKVAKDINLFITHMQKKLHISNKNTFIMGFSQGAMLAIFTGLTRRYKLGGVFPFAGIICGKDVLEKEIISHPDVYLFHGTSDLAVQYKTLDFTKDWLETHGISWEAVEYHGIEHKLIEDEMEDAAEIIMRSV